MDFSPNSEQLWNWVMSYKCYNPGSVHDMVEIVIAYPLKLAEWVSLLGREFWKQPWAVFKRTAVGGTEDNIVWKKNTVIDNVELVSDFVMKMRSDWSRVGP